MPDSASIETNNTLLVKNNALLQSNDRVQAFDDRGAALLAAALFGVSLAALLRKRGKFLGKSVT